MPRPHVAIIEARRGVAMSLLKTGMSCRAIAMTIGCSTSSVTRWRDMFKKRKSLKVRYSTGRPRFASYEKIVKILEGHREPLTSASVIVDLIRRKLGVRYHHESVRRLLPKFGWAWNADDRCWEKAA